MRIRVKRNERRDEKEGQRWKRLQKREAIGQGGLTVTVLVGIRFHRRLSQRQPTRRFETEKDESEKTIGMGGLTDTTNLFGDAWELLMATCR